LLVIAYGILKTRTPYYELGADYYDQLNPEKTIQRLVRRLGKLGVEIVITPKEANA
jgi:transposase